MKVLHIVNISFVLPYFLGNQIDHFQEKGINIFIASSPSEQFTDFASSKNINSLNVIISRDINLIKDLKAIIKVIKLIRREQIDVVIAHTPKGGLIGMIAAYLAFVKNRIYFRHGLVYETSRGFRRFFLKNIERFTGLLATKVICVSKSVLDISNRESLSAKYKNITLHNGTCNGLDAVGTFNKEVISASDIQFLKSKYGIKDNDKVIGYVGRLVNDKGIPELIDAWQKLILSHKDVKLLLIGPFEKRDSIEKAIKEFIKTEPSIIWTDLITDVAPHYALMDVFILPSYREGFPTVVLEASAMELPIITTRATGCIDSILEHETGRFTELSASGILENIEFYLENPLVGVQHGKNGRKFVLDSFNQNVIWDEIEKQIVD